MLFIGASIGYGVGFFVNQKSSPAVNQNKFHYSFSSKKEFFDQFYATVGQKKVSDKIYGIVVNHHLLAGRLIAENLSLAETQKIKTIILISPNHFQVGRGKILTSAYDWQTPYGVLPADREILRKLNGTAIVDEVPFEKEHGIFNEVAFIKKSFPKAKFVPIIIKDNLPESDAFELAEKLNSILPNDALVIASLDFAHEMTSDAADLADKKSMAILNNFDYTEVSQMAVDSKPSVRVFLKYLELRGAKKFNLVANSNSAKISGKLDQQDATSYITGYFTQ